MVRIRVLGPVEVWDGTRWQRLGAARQRALLAVLVVAAGRPVSIDRLTEEIWGQSAPKSKVNLIQQYVARLRRVLGDPAGELLRTQAPGYQLVLPAGELDTDLFERLVDQGGTALREGSHRTAASLLTEALGLWTGRPFGDVPASAAMEAEAARLDQVRLAALEARIDADLALGRHDVLVPQLQALTAAHPLRERFWGQIMLALFRTGRQAEALAAYQRLYRLLDDELGIEPSPPVRQLHQQILNTDPALDEPATPDSPASPQVPRQLPAAVTDFTGRDSQLARLDRLLPPPAEWPGENAMMPPAVVISAIAGTAGVGKTALAATGPPSAPRRG